MPDESDDSPSKPKRKTGAMAALMRFFGLVSGGDEAEPLSLGEGANNEAAQKAAKNLIDHARAFQALRVIDVMTPRVDIIAVELSSTLEQVAKVCVDSEHSRLPIYRETLDDPIGVVHVKDVLKLLLPTEDRPTPNWSEPILHRLRREILYVPASMTASELMLLMQSKRIHMALVIDEFGGTDGLLTLEDLIEAVVGEIDDEYDDETDDVLRSLPNGQFEADGRIELSAFEEAFGFNLYPKDTEEEVDTMAGLASFLAGRVPQRGEVIPHPEAGFDLEILDADLRRVKRIRLHRHRGAVDDPN